MKYVLSGEQAVDIESGTIEFQIKGGLTERLRLECDGEVVESGPRGWMASSVASYAQLYVVRQGSVSQPGGQVQVSLTSGADEVSLGVDIAGHASLLVLRLQALGDGRLRVTSVAGISLPPMAAEARAIASRQLQTYGARLDRGLGRDIAVTVDGSASMGWLADDVVPSLLEGLAGLDYLAGRDDALEIRVAGATGSFSGVPAGDVRSRFRAEYSSIQGAVAPDLWVPPRTSGVCWVVVSDHVPADIPARVDLVVVVIGDERLGVLLIDPDSAGRAVTVPAAALRLDRNGEASTSFHDFVRSVLRVVISETTEGVI
ncbi:MAG TPA: hypothetical protein PKE40_03695 [Arachnia sp.]|nr:hypothetical protein [Arachnia sp.]HMT85434.1 hypothetical protein [Arachnia sp.]